MKVKPADPNAVIRDPHTKVALPAEGAEVPDNTFWTRRLLDGDVVRIDEQVAAVAEHAEHGGEVREEEVRDQRDQPVGNEPLSPLTTRGGK